MIARNAELNSKINLMINNMISASYGFLRNGLVFLFLAALFVGSISYYKQSMERREIENAQYITESALNRQLSRFDQVRVC